VKDEEGSVGGGWSEVDMVSGSGFAVSEVEGVREMRLPWDRGECGFFLLRPDGIRQEV
jgi:hypothetical protein